MSAIAPPEPAMSNIGQEHPALTIRANIGTDLLALAYLRMKNEGLLGAMFWELTPDLIGFLKWCTRPDAVLCGCFCGDQLVGLGWLENVKVRAGKKIADSGEVFFRQYQGGGTTIAFGRMLLDYAFGTLQADVIYGTTPAKNLAAVRYLRYMGYTHLPPVPALCCWKNESCAGIISYLERTAWENRSGKANA